MPVIWRITNLRRMALDHGKGRFQFMTDVLNETAIEGLLPLRRSQVFHENQRLRIPEADRPRLESLSFNSRDSSHDILPALDRFADQRLKIQVLGKVLAFAIGQCDAGAVKQKRGVRERIDQSALLSNPSRASAKHHGDRRGKDKKQDQAAELGKTEVDDHVRLRAPLPVAKRRGSLGRQERRQMTSNL